MPLSQESKVAVLQSELTHLEEKVDDLQQEIHKIIDKIDQCHSETHKLIKELRDENNRQHAEVHDQIFELQKWRWTVIGAAAAMGIFAADFIREILQLVS